MQPAYEKELADIVNTAILLKKPVIIRYPRGRGTGVQIGDDFHALETGKAVVLEEGADIWLWALGDMVPIARDAAVALKKEGLSAGVVNARFVKPLDTALLRKHAAKARMIATLENGVIVGGFGSGVEECVHAEGLVAKVVKLGWPDEVVPHGSKEDLLKEYGLDAAGVAESLKQVCRAKDQT